MKKIYKDTDGYRVMEWDEKLWFKSTHHYKLGPMYTTLVLIKMPYRTIISTINDVIH